MGNLPSHPSPLDFHSVENPNSLSCFTSLSILSHPSISKSLGSSNCSSLCPKKPGLAVINSLSHESETFEETLIDSPNYNNKGTLFVPKFKIKVPTSLSLFYCAENITNPSNVTPNEMVEMSEEYTCVTFHRPKNETTHIFGDCVLKYHPKEFVDLGYNVYIGKITGTQAYQVASFYDSSASTLASASTLTPIFDSGFLKTCYKCNKSLEDSDDIYIYRDASFCSIGCRFYRIMADKHHKTMRKEMKKSYREKNNNGGNSSNNGAIFLLG